MENTSEVHCSEIRISSTPPTTCPDIHSARAMHPKTRKRLALLSGVFLTAFPIEVLAQEFRLEIVGRHVGCDLCESAEPYEQLFEDITDELHAIRAWMQGLGFREPSLPLNPDGSTDLQLFDPEGGGLAASMLRGWHNAYGHFDTINGIGVNFAEIPNLPTTTSDGNLPTEKFLDTEAQDTLAHELYHAVQYNSAMFDGPDWIVEGTATAVGFQWSGRLDGPRPDYGEALHNPSNPYARGHFFLRLGDDLGARDRVGYLAELADSDPVDGADGLIWLNDYLTVVASPLAEYFPNFIARHAQTPSRFGAAVSEEALNTRPPGIARMVAPLSVAPVAAHYTDATPVFESDWSGLPDRERVHLNTISIREPSEPIPLSLIIREDVQASHIFAEPILATQGEMLDPYNVRVSNVSDVPQESVAQTAILELETTPVLFELPVCMTTGQTDQLVEVAEASAEALSLGFGQGPYRLRASAGTISPSLDFIAPATTQRVDITAPVPTLAGGTRNVTVASTQVRADACMIQMRAGPGRITYDLSRDYSELVDSGSGQGVYLALTDFKVFRGEWFDPPAHIKARVVAGLLEVLNDGEVVSLGDRTKVVDEFEAHAMPLYLSRRFSWSNLQDAPGADGALAVRNEVTCPADVDASPCTQTRITPEGVDVTVTFESSGAPVTVETSGQTITFRYGNFPIRRPPGW